MKKIIFGLVLLAALQADAQHFQLGVKGGVNISNFTGGDFGDLDKKALVGFHGGIYTRFLFGQNLALQPEILFSSQGATLENATDEQNIKINYVNVPVVLQYITNGGFYLEAGPQFGFKVSEDIPDMPVEDFAKSTDVALALGLGLQTRSGFGIGGRYNVGISKVGDFDASDISPDFKQGVIQLSLFIPLFGRRN